MSIGSSAWSIRAAATASPTLGFHDFREVGGLVLPHSVAIEFGARLEEMTVEKVAVDPQIAEERFRLPAAKTGVD